MKGNSPDLLTVSDRWLNLPNTHKGANIVFDAEPLLAYLEDEPGSDHVAEYLREMEAGNLTAAISPVQVTEVFYVGDRLGSREVVEAFFRSLETDGLKISSAEKASWNAANFKTDGHSLGDSYALATASVEMATLIVGADSDFDIDTENRPFDIERIRTDPV